MSRRKCRIAVFGSFYRGFYLLNELLHGQFERASVCVVGVATDDPTAPLSAQSIVYGSTRTRL